jgi:hypothetical protein
MECLGQGCLGHVRAWGYSVLNEGVKNFVGKDGVVVIQMVAGCVFVVNVKSVGCV